MAVAKLGAFTFLHADQIDALYTVYTSTQIKTFFDTQATEIQTYLNNVLTVNVDTKASITGVETLTNKKITSRVGTEATNSTTSPNIDNYDIWTITALAGTNTFAVPTGTPTSGQKLIIRIKDNGTPRILAWNAIYRAVGVNLPLITLAGKTLYVGFVYNLEDTKWDCLAAAQEGGLI